VHGLALGALLALLIGCGEEEGNLAPSGGTTLPDCPTPADGAESVSNIVFQGDRYDYDPIPPGTDPRIHPLFVTIWNTLQVRQGLQCWQAQGGTNNLQFFENPAFGPGPRYRFVGTLDTEVGAMIVHSVGCYSDTEGRVFRAAVIMTYTGDLELLGVANDRTIDHFIGYQGSFPLITRYIATATNCL
jgi:hypothetical protein